MMAHEEKHGGNIERREQGARSLFVQKLAGDITAGAISALLITPPVTFIDQSVPEISLCKHIIDDLIELLSRNWHMANHFFAVSNELPQQHCGTLQNLPSRDRSESAGRSMLQRTRPRMDHKQSQKNSTSGRRTQQPLLR